ncbi:XRE family transcriptional regulator [Methylohalobius crimeensis]|uniref:XRE family transcriptional regulator n=1 Tax=Methylohalobius crimeensis TaxID=244365 RepID=UPI0003B4CA95|nr:helix-turn-helix transcriptional regulator [Methylohalobius crimeensis]
MSTIGERIKQARAAKGISQQALGNAVGVSRAAVSQWESGDSKGLKPENLLAVSKTLGVTVEWLVHGHGLMKPGEGGEKGKELYIKYIPITEWERPEDLPEGEYVFVPRYEVHFSAGNGSIAFDVMEKEQPQAFRTDWVKAKHLRSKNLACVYADGDSMEPRIHHGDVMLVDLSQKEIIDGKVYLIRYGDEIRVKRLYKRPDGGLIIHSDNTRGYPDIEVPPDQMSYIELLGRVIWTGGEV